MDTGGGHTVSTELLFQSLHHGWWAAYVKIFALQFAAVFFYKVYVKVPWLLVAYVGYNTDVLPCMSRSIISLAVLTA